MQKRLYRSRTDRMIGGVCGGLGEYLEFDPTIIRVIWVIIALMGGAGILEYLVMWIIVPETPGDVTPSPAPPAPPTPPAPPPPPAPPAQ